MTLNLKALDANLAIQGDGFETRCIYIGGQDLGPGSDVDDKAFINSVFIEYQGSANEYLTAAGTYVALPAATLVQSGISEFATVTEINTGTDSDRSLNVAQFNASIHGAKYAVLYAVRHNKTVTTGDGKVYFSVPHQINGMNLIDIDAHVGTPSSSGAVQMQLARLREPTPGGVVTVSDMLSTPLTIDQDERDSKDSAVPPVIDTAVDDVVEGDLLRVDIDSAGSGAIGMWVRLGFRK